LERVKAMTTEMGHNERTARLGLLADDARRGLALVEQGEGKTLEGWLAYGAALNEGRALFPSDEQFGQWVSVNLPLTEKHERSAAMWAAANPEDFETARASGNARTVRGIHAKWKEILAEREAKAARTQAEQEKAAAEEARLIAQERKAAADAQVAAEEKARRAAQEAKDEAERLAAQERHRTASAAREKAAQEAQEADERASFNEATAHAASIAAQKLEKKLESKKEKTPHVSHNSGENEWYTPAPFIEAARSVMGGIDLDPASSEIANRTVKADQIFTEQDDGLKQDWPIGRIWMNPPYAQPLMGQFANKFASEVRRGSEGVVLVNNATETAWFQTIAAECSAICFPKTRIRFLDPQGNPGAP